MCFTVALSSLLHTGEWDAHLYTLSSCVCWFSAVIFFSVRLHYVMFGRMQFLLLFCSDDFFLSRRNETTCSRPSAVHSWLCISVSVALSHSHFYYSAIAIATAAAAAAVAILAEANTTQQTHTHTNTFEWQTKINRVCSSVRSFGSAKPSCRWSRIPIQFHFTFHRMNIVVAVRAVIIQCCVLLSVCDSLSESFWICAETFSMKLCSFQLKQINAERKRNLGNFFFSHKKIDILPKFRNRPISTEFLNIFGWAFP